MGQLDRHALLLSLASAGVMTTGYVAMLFVASPAAQSQVADERSMTAQVAFIDQYCSACHNDSSNTAGLSLTKVNLGDVGEDPEVWEKVLRKVRARYMPPPGMPRPDEEEYDSFVAFLETSLDKAAASKLNPGRTDTFRRLNRTEYRNVIRDLLALEVDATELLPQDDSSHGFDNITVGELSPTLLERYLSAAQKISRLAVGRHQPVSGEMILLPPDLTQEEHFDDLPFGTRGGAAVPYTFPEDGIYEIQVRLTRDRNENVEGVTESAFLGIDADKLPPVLDGAPHQLEVALDGERLQLFSVVPPPASNDPRYRLGGGHDSVDKEFNVRIAVTAGLHELSAAFLKRPSTLLETERQPYDAHFNFYRHPRVQPALYSVSILGPYEASGVSDTPSRRRIFVCQPATAADEEGCAKQILSTLMRRAYRRPVTADEVGSLIRFFQAASAEAGFDAGIEAALRALLVRPEFLFHVEQDPKDIPSGAPYRLSDLQIASRLSFFLWSSIPDDELLDLAVEGRLRNRPVFERQVRRMLADKRAEALVTSFADQWLYLRNLATVTPDPRSFPDFDDNLRQALRQETELLFESIVREDRSVLDLLHADYTYLNERLAKHYGIPHVYGSQFRRVALPEDSPRRGLLGHGSILTATSYANRTSPVLRGKWVLANILGMPPPPPPPDVPPLKETGGANRVLTMRARLAEHRANPACAPCHRLMDPVGFSLENYDAVGRWRAREGGAPVDASGSLPGGGDFDGADGLRAALLDRPELFATALTEKLLMYAIGRGLEHYDSPAVRGIVREAEAHDFRFSSLILGVVESAPFQMRRSQ